MEMEREEQNKNAGFSLIEVVLSMVILAIISIPLLNYFGESMRYNTLTASKQKATLLAQEVMEELKEQKMVIKKDGLDYTIPYLTARSYHVDSNTLATSGSGTITLTGKAGTFQDKEKNIVQNYDVVVTATSAAAPSDTVSSRYGIDNAADVLAVDGKQDEEALVYFKAVNSSYCAANEDAEKKSSTYIQNNMKRVITVKITPDGAGYCVNVTYVYSCEGLQGTNPAVTFESSVLADEKVKNLKKLYLLYHASKATDWIEIQKDSGVSITPDLYLACQNKSSLSAGYQVRIRNLEPAATVHTNISLGNVVDDTTGFQITRLTKLADDSKKIRAVQLTVEVYNKGEAGVSGKSPQITVEAAKGE
jgi:prepilin-type N-terminal cleavage/methylation domain-containing protein